MSEWEDHDPDWVALEDFDTIPKPPPDPNALELQIVPLAEFAAVDEPGAEAILGTTDNAIIPDSGDVMVYGDGGVGKTTLVVDLTCHLAGGDDWLGLTVPRPVRVLLVENEGPRPLFRRKLERKLAGWQGSPLDDRVQILEEPWSELDFVDPAWRDALGRAAADREIDLLAVGPVTSAGMEGAGTIAEARAFLTLVKDVRARSGRPLAIVLVHHENKGGKVSGAWEGTGDTLLHVQQQGHGRLRLYFQKTRWASEQHATTLQLVWAAGDSFELDDSDANRPEQVWATLEQFVLEHPGCSWNAVTTTRNDGGTKIVRGQVKYLAQRRDQMLADGVLINAGRGGSFELWHRDDPARPPLFDDPDEVIPEVIPERENRPAEVIPEAESFRENGDSATGSGTRAGDRFPDSRLKGNRGPAHHPPSEAGPIPDQGKPASEEDDW